MNSKKWTLLLTVVLLTAATAAFLNRLQGARTLGPPGLKTVAAKVLGVDGATVGTNTIDLPATVLEYQSSPLPVSPAELGWLPKDTTFGRRRYQTPHDFIDVSIVLMGADRTSIHRPQVCLESQGWHIERSEILNIPVARPHEYELPVMRLISGGKGRRADGSQAELKAIFVYWFVSDRRLTASHGERMWWMATDLISTGILPRWAYVTFLSICMPGEEEKTFDRMKRFIAASVPEFQLVTRPVSVATGPNPRSSLNQIQN